MYFKREQSEYVPRYIYIFHLGELVLGYLIEREVKRQVQFPRYWLSIHSLVLTYLTHSQSSLIPKS